MSKLGSETDHQPRGQLPTPGSKKNLITQVRLSKLRVRAIAFSCKNQSEYTSNSIFLIFSSTIFFGSGVIFLKNFGRIEIFFSKYIEIYIRGLEFQVNKLLFGARLLQFWYYLQPVIVGLLVAICVWQEYPNDHSLTTLKFFKRI